jgi:glyoxylase I family protein
VTAPPTLGPLTHVAVTVTDLDVSVPWYTALTGADPVLDEDTGPFRHVVFALGDTLFGLHAFGGTAAADGPEFSPRHRGLDHVAFACADEAELHAWADRLQELGIAHGGVVSAHYGSGLSFKDPDGIALELFAPPGAAHS